MKATFTISDLEKLQASGRIRGFVMPQKQEAPAKKKSKYGDNKKEVDGLVFDSHKEAKRYGQLKMLMKKGEIGQQEFHKVYDLVVEGQLVCKYEADFVYMIMATGETVVEDVKSDPTRKIQRYILKKKLMKAVHGITIKEV